MISRSLAPRLFRTFKCSKWCGKSWDIIILYATDYGNSLNFIYRSWNFWQRRSWQHVRLFSVQCKCLNLVLQQPVRSRNCVGQIKGCAARGIDEVCQPELFSHNSSFNSFRKLPSHPTPVTVWHILRQMFAPVRATVYCDSPIRS
jgi:hypothetical protein